METQPKAVKNDRLQTRQRMGQVIEVSRSVLENSNLLIEGAPIGPAELQLTRRLIQAVAPVDIDSFHLHEHLQLSAKFARNIGQQLTVANPTEFGNLNLDELEVLVLLHDFGRFTTHRFYRNDIVEGLEFRAIGLREDLVKKLPSIANYLKKDPTNPDEVDDAFNNLSIEQKIVEVADVHGKRKDDGSILTFDEVMDYHRKSRTQTGNELYASEKQKDQQFIQFCEKVYDKLRAWLSAKGVSVDDVREVIRGEELSSSIEAVIFDVGDVLVLDPEVDVIPEMAKRFGIDEKTAESAWGQVTVGLQTGSGTEEDMWRNYAAIVDKPLPADHADLAAGKLRTEVTPEMKELLTTLQEKGYRLAALSDTIPAHAKKLTDAGVYDDFEEVILSPDIKVTKKSEGGEPFHVAAARLYLAPQACVFIDNKKPYADAAQKVGMKGIFFTTPDQLKKDLVKIGIAL